MAAVKTPVKGFTGQVVGVAFANGVGETDNAAALSYFRRHGYTVEEVEKSATIPEGKPSTDWKGDELKAYAEQHEIDLGSAKTKAEIVDAIESTEKSTPAGSDDADGKTAGA